MTATQQSTSPESASAGRFTRSSAPAGEGRVPRPRRAVPPWSRPIVRLFFRYSYSRDAYVLRLVGRRRGPVVTNL